MPLSVQVENASSLPGASGRGPFRSGLKSSCKPVASISSSSSRELRFNLPSPLAFPLVSRRGKPSADARGNSPLLDRNNGPHPTPPLLPDAGDACCLRRLPWAPLGHGGLSARHLRPLRGGRFGGRPRELRDGSEGTGKEIRSENPRALMHPALERIGVQMGGGREDRDPPPAMH